MFLHVLIFIFLDSGLGQRNTVHGMVPEVSSVQSALNTFMIAILIYLVFSQIFALGPTFQGHITYLYVLNLSWKFSKKIVNNFVHYNY
jgi:hypothetical protein